MTRSTLSLFLVTTAAVGVSAGGYPSMEVAQQHRAMLAEKNAAMEQVELEQSG